MYDDHVAVLRVNRRGEGNENEVVRMFEGQHGMCKSIWREINLSRGPDQPFKPTAYILRCFIQTRTHRPFVGRGTADRLKA